MSTATWEPSPANFDLSPAKVSELLQWIATHNLAETGSCPFSWLNEAAKSSPQWQNLATELDDASLISLIRFFTLAEENAGWNLKDKAVVITLFKALRKRSGTDKELVKWVKASSSNKFLPFGAVL